MVLLHNVTKNSPLGIKPRGELVLNFYFFKDIKYIFKALTIFMTVL